MALRYFLVQTQIPEFTYARTTVTAMLQNYKQEVGPLSIKLEYFDRKVRIL